jgi:phospholipase C
VEHRPTCHGEGTVPLRRAHDRTLDVPHQFINGVIAVDGGRMDCFNQFIHQKPNLAGYVQYGEDQIPRYWAYARHFELADRFFTSAYAPTAEEHLWAMAGSTDGFTATEEGGRLDGKVPAASTATTRPNEAGRSARAPRRVTRGS